MNVASLFGLAWAVSLTASPSLAAEARVYAGGVAGVEDLVSPEHSAAYRAAGGGLYIHNSGWGALKRDQQTVVLHVFEHAPVALELGFGANPDGAGRWASACRQNYVDQGIRPVFVAANAFDGNAHPTLAQWKTYTLALRTVGGLPATTLVLPTFEYANFGPNIPLLTTNKLSQSPLFQSLVKEAGGIVLDAPCGYFFSREQNYRDWIIDALAWTKAQHFKTVLIASPHDTGAKYAEEAQKYVRFLTAQGVLPDIVVCENYVEPTPPGYPNRVGDEKSPETVLGVALGLLKGTLPGS